MARGSRKARDLQSTLHSQAYKQRCSAELLAFVSWLGGSSDFKHLRPKEANSLLIRYVQNLHDTGKPLTRATHAVLGLQARVPRLRGRLQGAWSSILSWKLAEPYGMRLPMPLPVMRACFLISLLHAFVWEPQRAGEWFSLAVALQAAFHG